jgi:hypothetical protein
MSALATCVVCRGIAFARCRRCGADLCDTVCGAAHERRPIVAPRPRTKGEGRARRLAYLRNWHRWRNATVGG